MAGQGIVIFNKIDALFQEISTELNNRPLDESTVLASLCWSRTGISAEETLFPVTFFSNTPKKRGRYEERKHTPPELANFSCPTFEWSPDGEMIAKGTLLTDLYGIFRDKMPDIVMQSQIDPEYELARMLGQGQDATLGLQVFDNLPFFHTAKLANPNRASAGTNRNLEVNLNLDRAGLNLAFDYHNKVKGPDGRRFRAPGRKVVVVSTEDQYDRAARELFGTTVAQAVGANAAAGVSNPDQTRGRADLILFPELADYDNAKGWYVFKIVNSQHRPLIFSQVAPPEPYYEGLSPNEHSRVTRNVIKYGVSHFYGLGYGWPELAWKGIEK